MIDCDNDFCEYEWFHYSCVGITRKPRGKWYCSEECRSAGENQLLLIIFCNGSHVMHNYLMLFSKKKFVGETVS